MRGWFFFDLGVSSMQLDKGRKGFSFSEEGPLDMRMDPSSSLTAMEIVNQWTEKQLGELFRLGEEPRWRKAAHAIVEGRRKKAIKTTTQLADVISSSLRTLLKGKLHPATLIFQALRMCVNRELEEVTEGIAKAIQHLSSGGVIGIISFHSLEDRIVKHIFKQASMRSKNRTIEPVLHVVTKKPVVPTQKEMRTNPRSRSAKMRIAEKI